MTPAGVCIAGILLAPLAAAGMALINTGLGRSRSAAHTMLAALCIMASAAIAYVICGFAWEGLPGHAAYIAIIGGKEWSWLGTGHFFLSGLNWDDGSPSALAAWLQIITVGAAAMIPFGAGADRWRLGAACVSTLVLAVIVYPLFGHWTWGGGWLAMLGPNYALGRGYFDSGGSGPIHAVGGLTALSIAWILGPRRGKMTLEGMPAAIPGHNAVLVLLGCFLAWLGWTGVNLAGAILFTVIEPGRAPLIAVNTMLACMSAALMSMAVTRWRFGKPDASLCANGWIGGLAACAGACGIMHPAAAIIVGLVAGLLVPLSVEWLELHLGLDDPGGAISAHAICGIWGVLCVGLFGRFAAEETGQWVAQVAGIATLLGFALPAAYGLNWLFDRIYRQRVTVEGERQGMDLYELGAGAYPDFSTHDDFLQR